MWIDTKKENGVLIKSFSSEYNKKELLYQLSKYKDGGFMDKYVLNPTLKMFNQKKGKKATEFIDGVGFFCKVKRYEYQEIFC